MITETLLKILQDVDRSVVIRRSMNGNLVVSLREFKDGQVRNVGSPLDASAALKHEDVPLDAVLTRLGRQIQGEVLNPRRKKKS